MNGIVVKIVDRITGRNKFPVSVDRAIYSPEFDKYIPDCYVKRDYNGHTYYGERISLKGHHFLMEQLGNFVQSSPSGAIQGGDVYDGKFYQFYDGGGVMTIDIASKTKLGYFNIPGITSIFSSFHFGSVSFSNEFENDADVLPLIYASGGVIGTDYYVGVFNINGGANGAHLVRYFKLNNGVTDSICAFDFASKKGWCFGYTYQTTDIVHKDSPYQVLEFSFTTSGSGDISNTIVSASQTYLIPNLGRANLQDAIYSDGHIFLLAGGSYNYYAPDGTDQMHIGDFDVMRKQIVANIPIPTFTLPDGSSFGQGEACLGEGESIGIYGNDQLIVGMIKNGYYPSSHIVIKL